MLAELSLGAGVAMLTSLIVCRIQMAIGPVDEPNAVRKAHNAATPTAGGIGIAAGLGAGLIALGLYGDPWRGQLGGDPSLALVAAFACAFLAVGFVDDARPIGARLKFLIFAVLSLAAAAFIGVVHALPIDLATNLEFGFALGLGGTALWVFTLVNCVNFMDGANGLAMGSAAIGLAALAAIALARGSPAGAAIGLCGAGAIAGFLVWNFPHGRLFAGDSGALFVGALAALDSLLIIEATGLSPFVPPILFFPLLADALLTLAWRAGRGRSLLDGHAEHLYQIAMRAGWRHAGVALAYWVAMALCALAGVWAATAPSAASSWIALAILAALAVVSSAAVRLLALRRGIAED